MINNDAKLTEIVDNIVAAIKPTKIYLFGSAARGEATESSDLDILIELEAGRSLLDLIAMQQDLEDLLGIKVDIVTEAGLSPYIRDDVLKEAVPL